MVGGVVVGEADTCGAVVGDTVGAQVNLRQQAVLHSPATASLVSQSSNRGAHSPSDSLSGYTGSPVHRHMADGDEEGELVAGAVVGALVVGSELGVPVDGVELGTLDDGEEDGAAEGVLVVGDTLGVLVVGDTLGVLVVG